MIRFAAVGLNHGHIYGQVSTLLAAGAELAWVFAEESELVAAFSRKFPQAKIARSYEEILDDDSVAVITTAAIPSERAGVSIAAMQRGKDVLSDKPGCTTLAQLEEIRRVQSETGRIYSILFGERLENPATLRAGELVKSGAIGRIVQTMGWGPHRASLPSRSSWFFDREEYGGILCDIGSHQCEQFLYFSGAREVEILSAQVGNAAHPEYSGLEDFGDATLRGKTPDGDVCGYFRVDWFTPNGLPTWGDGRLIIVGTEGTIEVRKYCDLAGREGGNHLFLTDKNGVQYINCSNHKSAFGNQFIDDVLHRTETAMPHQHCFAATELALRVQAAAQKFGHLL
jgi:predicted dehydrogenase